MGSNEVGFMGEFKNYAIGGLSGTLAILIVLPIDYLKVQIQVLAEGHRHVRSHPFTLFTQIIKEKGFFEFYRGCDSAIIRQMLLATIRLGLYKSLVEKEKRKSPTAEVSFVKKMGFSLFSGAVGSFIATPFDLALVRMQSDRLLPLEKRRNYHNIVDAIVKIKREEGIKGYWKGATPVILRVSSINFAMLVFDDYFQEFFNKRSGNFIVNRVASSFLASFIACCISLPFDNLKTKYQKMIIGENGAFPYKGVTDCLLKSIKNEGIFGLYVGFPVYVMRIAPHCILTLLFQDMLHHSLKP